MNSRDTTIRELTLSTYQVHTPAPEADGRIAAS